MLQISLMLLVATFGVAVVRLAQVWKAERGFARTRALAVAGERLAA